MGPNPLGPGVGEGHPGRPGAACGVAAGAVVHVTGPGSVGVHKGDAEVAVLKGGDLSGPGADVFASRWLPESFAPAKAALLGLHDEARERARAEGGAPWAPLDPDLDRLVAQHALRRVVAMMRAARHGGTLVFVPPEVAGGILGEEPHLSFRHPLAEGEPRHRFRTLIVGIMNRLAQVHGEGEGSGHAGAVGWEKYEESTDRGIAALDEAVFELARLLAALSAVDGAVVMTKHLEVLGFGAEISGALPPVRTVERALDPEGERTERETTDGVGTRHRSAYRLCGALPGAVAVVVSQDGGARFVTGREGAVTYWDYA